MQQIFLSEQQYRKCILKTSPTAIFAVVLLSIETYFNGVHEPWCSIHVNANVHEITWEWCLLFSGQYACVM